MSIVRLTTCNNVIEANLLKDLLENEGIECFLTNENITNLMPGHANMFGAGIQIMINASDGKRAVELISQQGAEKIACPNCGSENIAVGLGINKFKKIAIVILSLLFAIPFNNIHTTYFCKQCKKEFKT